METDSAKAGTRGGEEVTSLLMDLSMYAAALSAILLLILAGIYLRVYRDTRAQFSLGLVVFAILLFAQNLVSVYSFLTQADFVLEPFLPFLLAINVAEVLAVVVLLRTTAR